MKGSALTPSMRNVGKRLLDKCQQGGGQVLVTLLPTHRRLLQWCITEDILDERALLGRQFTFTTDLFRRINDHLAFLGEAKLDQALATTSLKQASQGSTEYKSVREGPREHRVLRASKVSDQWLITDEDVRTFNLEAFSELVMVENLDCFYALQDFALPLASDAIVIYRGDQLYSKGAATLRKSWITTGKPSKYFGDLDIEGFLIGQQNHFRYIAVPPLARFQAQSSHAAYTPEQHARREHLLQLSEDKLYIEFMLREQKAMLQQWLTQSQVNAPLEWIKLSQASDA